MYGLWPRAGGKTSGGIGPRVERLSQIMPRSQTLLVADSFERIGKVLLPSIENFLCEELGLLPDIDFVVHKKPPEHWTKPLFIPAKFDHITSFATGYALCEVSLEVSGSANGYNAQSVIGDEVKFFDEKKFKSEVRPAIRGGRNTRCWLDEGKEGTWADLPEFQSMWMFTDKFPSKGSNIGWVLNKKAEMNQNYVDIIYTLEMRIIELKQAHAIATTEKEKAGIHKEISRLKALTRPLQMDLIYYCDALPYENIDNLGEKYFRDLRRDLTPYEYKVAIENKDPNTAPVPFYPDLNADHFYKSKIEYNPNKPLIIAMDYQFSISPICIAQLDELEESVYTTLNFVSSVYTLHPLGLAAAVEQFCKLFQHHPTKHVYYVYDHTAIGRSPWSKTFKDLVCETLNKCDWSVTELFTGDAPDHDIKYERFKFWLNCRSDFGIKINEETNTDLKISLEKAAAVIVQGKTKKDKTSEKPNSGVDPRHATHWSDVFDQLVWAACEMQLCPISDDVGLDITPGKR